MTDYRLLQLGKDTRGELLPKGHPTLISNGVLVTLADSDGNVMIEHSSAQGSAAADVRVDGKPVYEVAHLRPLQVVEVDGSRYVLMPPYGTFVQENSAEEAETAVPSKAKKVKTKAKATASKEQPRRLKLVYVAAPALLVLLGIGLSLVPEQKPAEAVTEQHSTDESGDAAEAGETSEEDSPSSPNSPPSPESAAAISAPVALDVPLMLQNLPHVQPGPQAASDAESAQAAPAPKPAPKATAVKSPQPKATTGKTLSPEREAQISALAESYQLEGGFDPEGAVKKLRALKKQVPANARAQSDIDKALRSLGG